MDLQVKKQMTDTIKGFITINQDILSIPGLSNEQRSDLIKLGNQLNNLELQTDKTKIKIQLLDIFNKLD
jgi:F0F1-type ATP synthase alpha subunit